MAKDDIFKVAMLQMAPIGNIEGNIEKAVEFCRQAKNLGADIAVFPEMWSNGYEQLYAGCSSSHLADNLDFPQEKIDAWQSKAISDDSEFVRTFTNLAKELEMAIAMTYMEKTSGKPRNTVLVVDRLGRKVLKYSKVHTVDWTMEQFLEPGKEFVVGELDYGCGKVKLGAMICFDREFPESARILMLEGAEVIIVPNAVAKNMKIRLEQLKIRAFENVVGVAMANYPGEGWGHSSAYSPIWRRGKNYEVDMKLAEMGEDEGIAIAGFDLDEMRKYRTTDNFGDAYRKPRAYGDLVKLQAVKPFVRELAQGREK